MELRPYPGKEMMKEWWSWSASVMVQHSLVILLFLLLAMKALHVLWLKPKKLERLFWRQGMRGPPRRLVIGNVGEMVAMVLAASSMPVRSSSYHNILPASSLFLHQWKKAYGSIFLMWFGPTPRVVVAEPELIREVLVTRVQLFDRYVAHPFVRQLEGEGLVNLRGAKWALHRKLISPVFKSDNLRLLMPTVGEKVVAMVEKLLTVAGRSSGEVEVDVAEWYQSITEDVITRVTFGRSYADGKAVFNLQARLMVLAAEAFNRVFVPGYRYLPTKKNRERWKLDVDIRQNLAMLVSRREKSPARMKRRRSVLGCKGLAWADDRIVWAGGGYKLQRRRGGVQDILLRG
ncbi:hypothetical protein HPP92_022898 [Vanilla planifolia]|uniref:Cytochrome P450 n=1 Tax=Vanilla planifolia TaxID=51239 RepID=A0A835PT48_VANPL|nr:hypothetical protein HPP92_022898 [Vanilla planifolia]